MTVRFTIDTIVTAALVAFIAGCLVGSGIAGALFS